MGACFSSPAQAASFQDKQTLEQQNTSEDNRDVTAASQHVDTTPSPKLVEQEAPAETISAQDVLMSVEPSSGAAEAGKVELYEPLQPISYGEKDVIAQLLSVDEPIAITQRFSTSAHVTHSDDGASNLSLKLLKQHLASSLEQSYCSLTTKAAGLRHIGFGPMGMPLKRENQDEYFVQVGGFGGQPNGCCYAIFDGHGTNGGYVAHFCRRELPHTLDADMRTFYLKLADMESQPLKNGIEHILIESFVSTEQRLQQSGLNVASSGTTASVVYQDAHLLWVAAAGDSRVILVSKQGSSWVPIPLTIDHRPSRRSEKKRVEAAGGRVEPKRLPSGRTVGEPRLWLQHIPSPGLLLSRSIGDAMASSVGCTAKPEVTCLALRPHIDAYLVIASDGVWDVLGNEAVCQIVSNASDPSVACSNILEAALCEWEGRLAADNISVIVSEFEWE